MKETKPNPLRVVPPPGPSTDGSGVSGGGTSGGGGGRGKYWLDNMTMVRKVWANTTHNCMLVLKHDEEWLRGGQPLCYDDFAQRTVLLHEPPFHPEFREKNVAAQHDPHAATSRNSSQRYLGYKEVDDVDLTNTAAWIERYYGGIRPTSAMVAEAIELVARTNKRHPVRDFVRRKIWDGTERVGRLADPTRDGDRGAPSWLHRYLGAEDNDYSRRVGRWWLISAIARIMRPGCQADSALIIEGVQGLGKSSGLRALSEPWFSEDLGNIQQMKESQQQINGVWIIEAGELEGLSRASDATVKKFISQPHDRYRPPYGRRPKDFPRQCVFAGTTNNRSYLTDVTGNRRFWPVWTTKADVDLIREEREQIWAEAFLLYNQGVLWWPRPDETAELKEEQESRMEQDPWLDPTATFVMERERKAQDARKWGNVEEAQSHDMISMGDVLSALGIDKSRWGDVEAKRIAKIMTVLGRERVRRTQGNGLRTFVFVPPQPREEEYVPPPSLQPTAPASAAFEFETSEQADLPFFQDEDERDPSL